MEVHFNGYDCQLNFGQYRNGAKAITLVSSKDGSPVAVATVNIEDYPLEDDEILVKDYSENEGMHQALLNANIVHTIPSGTTSTGYVEVSCLRLTQEALEAYNKAKGG
jgi:hypothetical protein